MDVEAEAIVAAMMEENGVEDLSQLGGSEGTIQLALDALKEKKSSVDQVRQDSPLFFSSTGVHSRHPGSPFSVLFVGCCAQSGCVYSRLVGSRQYRLWFRDVRTNQVRFVMKRCDDKIKIAIGGQSSTIYW